MLYPKRNEFADKENRRMKKLMLNILKDKDFKENDVKNLIGKQRIELNIESGYYKGNIAEGNWSLLKDEKEVKDLDEGKHEEKAPDLFDTVYGIKDFSDKDARKKDAEYEYIFKPSYYAVRSLIHYYLNYRTDAKKIYNLKNAILRQEGKKKIRGITFYSKIYGRNYKARSKG